MRALSNEHGHEISQARFLSRRSTSSSTEQHNNEQQYQNIQSSDTCTYIFICCTYLHLIITTHILDTFIFI